MSNIRENSKSSNKESETYAQEVGHSGPPTVLLTKVHYNVQVFCSLTTTSHSLSRKQTINLARMLLARLAAFIAPAFALAADTSAVATPKHKVDLRQLTADTFKPTVAHGAWWVLPQRPSGHEDLWNCHMLRGIELTVQAH